jgi:hypothetical protein
MIYQNIDWEAKSVLLSFKPLYFAQPHNYFLSDFKLTFA